MPEPTGGLNRDIDVADEIAADEAAVEAERTASKAARAPTPAPFKRYDNQPFSPEAEKELERVVDAFRHELVKKAVRAKNDVRGDVVSAHNVKTVAPGSLRHSRAFPVTLVKMSSNVILGAAFGALVSILVAPPPEGLKPATIGLLVALVTLGTIGVVWQLMRED